MDSPTPEAPHRRLNDTIRPVFAVSGCGEKRDNGCLGTAAAASTKHNGNCIEMTPTTVEGCVTPPGTNNGCAAAAEETNFSFTKKNRKKKKIKKKKKFRNGDDKMETSPPMEATVTDSVDSESSETETANRRLAVTPPRRDGLSAVDSPPSKTLRPPPPPPLRQSSHLSDSAGPSSADERTALFPLAPPTDSRLQSSVCSRQYLKRYYFKYSSSPTSNGILEATKAKRKLARARERRATLVLGIVMASFIGCWLPFFSIYPVTSLTGLEVPSEMFGVIFWLGYCNSALNPIIYTIFNREFRQAFHKILFRHLPGRAWV